MINHITKNFDGETLHEITATIPANADVVTHNLISTQYMAKVKEIFGHFESTSHNVTRVKGNMVLTYIGYTFED
jgi:hypothetical protein